MKDNNKNVVQIKKTVSPDLHKVLLYVGFVHFEGAGNYVFDYELEPGFSAGVVITETDAQSFESVLKNLGMSIFDSSMPRETRKICHLLSQDIMSHYQIMIEIKNSKVSNN